MQRLRGGNVTLIDVRPVEEFSQGHLPGAVSIPLENVKAWSKQAPRRRQIVAYCRGPLLRARAPGSRAAEWSRAACLAARGRRRRVPRGRPAHRDQRGCTMIFKPFYRFETGCAPTCSAAVARRLPASSIAGGRRRGLRGVRRIEGDADQPRVRGPRARSQRAPAARELDQRRPMRATRHRRAPVSRARQRRALKVLAKPFTPVSSVTPPGRPRPRDSGTPMQSTRRRRPAAAIAPAEGSSWRLRARRARGRQSMA